MNTDVTCGAFLLVGLDAEGETRESTHASLEQAATIGRECSRHDSNGPAWRSWEIWGNHPETGEWSPLVCSIIAKFKLGRIVATPNALSCLTRDDILTALGRHQAGDWGELDDHDRQVNESSLLHGCRLVSIYRAANGTKFYVITEADRRSSTILLPEDY